jgi:hypothetical protein
VLPKGIYGDGGTANAGATTLDYWRVLEREFTDLTGHGGISETWVPWVITARLNRSGIQPPSNLNLLPVH